MSSRLEIIKLQPIWSIGNWIFHLTGLDDVDIGINHAGNAAYLAIYCSSRPVPSIIQI
uniref:Uncharacterized protein n=1 Tax=Anguilla anguilla TaxID=7936 RepID=A0A0E9W0B0_ANGAN